MPEPTKTCFVIMPISTPSQRLSDYREDSKHFEHVYEHLFCPAITKAGLLPTSPAASGSEVIQAGIIKNLAEADLVLCDLSSLNANVFFEFGIRTALNLPVVIVADEKTPNIPFDIHLINRHTYESSLDVWSINNQIDSLAIHITNSINKSSGSNALWKYFGISASSQLNSEPATPDDKLNLILDELNFIKQQQNALESKSLTTQDLATNMFEAEKALRRARLFETKISRPTTVSSLMLEEIKKNNLGNK